MKRFFMYLGGLIVVMFLNGAQGDGTGCSCDANNNSIYYDKNTTYETRTVTLGEELDLTKSYISPWTITSAVVTQQGELGKATVGTNGRTVTYVPNEVGTDTVKITYTKKDENLPWYINYYNYPYEYTITIVEAETGTLVVNVYRDLNGNGTQDAGEPGMSYVDGMITDENNAEHNFTTNSDGNYTLANVPTGIATVEIDESTLISPDGMDQTEGENPSDVTVPADGTVTDINGYVTVVIDNDGDQSPAGVDCNDSDPDVYPGAIEINGDGIDSNCDTEDNVTGFDACFLDPQSSPTCPGYISQDCSVNTTESTCNQNESCFWLSDECIPVAQ